jgi:hypothetical protein
MCSYGLLRKIAAQVNVWEAKMDTELTINETQWGVHVIMQAGLVVNEHNFLQNIRQIVAICKETKKHKVLIDAQYASRNVPTLKLLEGVEFIQHSGCLAYKIALIAPMGIVSAEDSRFVTTAGYNRAIFIHYFLQPDEALAWLLGNNI